MGFPKQEYWSGLPFPSPRDLPDPGIKPASPPLAGRFFYHWATREVLPKDTVFFLRHHWGQTGSRHPGGAEFPEGSYCSSYCQEVQPQASLGPGWVSEQGTGSHIQSLGSFRTDASYLWCWRRLLRGLWTVWSNKSILKEINPEYSLERLMLKLKSQYFVHLTWRANSLEKILMLGKTEGRRRGQQRMRLLNGTTDSMDVNLSKLQEVVKDRAGLACCSPWDLKELDMTEQLNKNISRKKKNSLQSNFSNFQLRHKGLSNKLTIFDVKHTWKKATIQRKGKQQVQGLLLQNTEEWHVKWLMK